MGKVGCQRGGGGRREEGQATSVGGAKKEEQTRDKTRENIPFQSGGFLSSEVRRRQEEEK